MSRPECWSSRQHVRHPEQKHFAASFAVMTHGAITYRINLEIGFLCAFQFGSQFSADTYFHTRLRIFFFDTNLISPSEVLCNLLTNAVIKVFFTWSLLMSGGRFMGDVHNSSRHYPVQYVIYVGGCLPCCQTSYIWKACVDSQTTGWAVESCWNLLEFPYRKSQ